MRSDSVVIGIDQGSTGTKVTCLDCSGKTVANAHADVHSFSPTDGWVEHNPVQIWESVLHCFSQLAPQIAGRGVEAIGITNQRETTVLWDKHTGVPVYNAISWQCRRSSSICKRFMNLEEEIRSRTGSPLDAYYSATKILWLFENVPEVRERAMKGELLFGTIDTWLIWNLTGGQCHVTDSSNASRTLLYHIRDKDWDPFLLETFGIPHHLLPTVKPSNAHFGDAHLPSDLTSHAVPILSCLGDQQSALFGQTCFRESEAKCTFGTCLNLGVNTGESIRTSPHGLTPTVAWNLSGSFTYKVEGGVYVAGSLLEWLVKKVKLTEHVHELTELAMSVNSSENLALVPAFVGLAAPYWDMTARGLLIGLSFNHDRAHIARASLESIGLQTYDVLKTVREDLKIEVKTVNVDGGMAKNDFLMQMVADLGDCSIIRPKELESTSLGVVYLAGIHAGFWKDLSEISSLRIIEKAFEPRMCGKERDALINNWSKAIERSRGWSY